MFTVVESMWSPAGTLGQNSQETFTLHVAGDPDPAKDDADNYTKVLKFTLARCATVSPLGNIFSDFSFEHAGYGTGRWKCEAIYKTPELNRSTEDSSFSFKIGGQMTHIDASLATVAAYAAPGKTPINFNKAINVSGVPGNITVAGTERYTPSFDFKTTFYVSSRTVAVPFGGSTSPIQTLADDLKAHAGSVNSDVVNINVDGISLTFQPGELLLIGGDGQKRVGFGDWEVGLEWSSFKNQASRKIQGITVAQQNGWDLLWFYYGGPEVDAAGKALAPKAAVAYVEQIYEYVPLGHILPPQTFGTSTIPNWLVDIPTIDIPQF